MNEEKYRRCILALLEDIQSEKTLRRIYFFVDRLWRNEGKGESA